MEAEIYKKKRKLLFTSGRKRKIKMLNF